MWGKVLQMAVRLEMCSLLRPQDRDVFAEAWQKLYGITPDVIHIHASLESAILADYLGGIDTISIGAETVGAHTYEEKASIESLDHTYCVLQEVLENMQ